MKKKKEVSMGLGSALILLAAFIIFGYWEQKEDVGLSLKEYYFEVLIVYGVFGIIFGIILIIVAIVLLIQRKRMFLTFRLKKRHRPKVILTPEEITTERTIEQGEFIFTSRDELVFKIIVIGDKGVGKKFLARKCFASNGNHIRTLGVELGRQMVVIDEQFINFQFWILGDQVSLFPLYCNGSNGAIVMYDISNKNSLKPLSEYIQTIRESAGDIPIFLVGNKADLKSREVSKHEAIKIRKKYNLSSFMEISLKHDLGVNKMFRKISFWTFFNFNCSRI